MGIFSKKTPVLTGKAEFGHGTHHLYMPTVDTLDYGSRYSEGSAEFVLFTSSFMENLESLKGLDVGENCHLHSGPMQGGYMVDVSRKGIVTFVYPHRLTGFIIVANGKERRMF